MKFSILLSILEMSEFQIGGSIEDSSKIMFFFISQCKFYVVTPH